MDADDELTPTVLAQVARRRPRTLFGVPVALALLFLLIGLLRGAQYRVEVTFLPEPDPDLQLNANALSGMAGRLALGAPPATGENGPGFYLELLASDRVLHAVVRSPYPLPGRPSQTADLAAIWGIHQADSARREAAAVDRLRDHIAMHTGYTSGLVHLRVDAGSPGLAAAIAGRFIELADQFNRSDRRSRGRAEREFLEQRLDTMRVERAAAEDRLAAFLRTHRGNQDPGVDFEQDRLRTEVDHYRDLESSLAGALERARTEEVRTTPVLTVVNPPLPPARPRPRLLPVLLVLGFAAGALVTWPLVIWQETLAMARAQGRADWRAYAEARGQEAKP